jgi:hypothetical protein
MHRIAIALGAGTEDRTLDGCITVGGSRSDPVVVPGAPPRAVRLEACAAGVVAEAAAPGVRAAGAALPAGTRRLLRPGERVELHGASIAVLPPSAPESTRAAAGALLRGVVAGLAPPGLRLVVLTGPDAGRCLPLEADLAIGRGRSAELRIPDPQASRRHARVRLGPGGVTVEDLGSKNGVRVNGVRIDGPRALRPGDALGIGGTLVALDDPGEAGAVAPPSPRLASGPRLRAARLPARIVAAALLALSATALAVAGS